MISHTTRLFNFTNLSTNSGGQILGINLAFTRFLLARQCNVLLTDLSLRLEAQDLVNAHSSRTSLSNGRAIFQRTDVRVWADLERMFEVAAREFEGVDIVCPGAGIYEPVSRTFSGFEQEIPRKEGKGMEDLG